ncbi:hypothetical protein BB561_006435 [Smittium simulii]|uniref:Uncharacterized protein n=1 Tax=Smittium simulii TaxID=133385 RepID=A0A2T9Y4B4_9FUNG|nr:hypothetical protein BB561_006435 [Smittium simulii]
MSMARNIKLKSNIDNACRAVIDCGSSITLSRLRNELKIATVNTRTAVARKRAYYKWPTLNTWMPALMAAPMKSQLSTWVSGTTKWVKRYCQGMSSENDKSKITAWIAQIMAGRIRSVGLIELVYPEYSQSIQSIIKIRSGCFNTMLKLARAKIADSKYLDHCPCCNMNVAESIEHMIFECTQWSNQRTSTIGHQFPNVNLLVPSSTCARLVGALLRGELVITTAGLRQLQSSTPTVSNILSIYVTLKLYKINDHKKNFFLLPMATYGGELFGMSIARITKFNALLTMDIAQ